MKIRYKLLATSGLFILLGLIFLSLLFVARDLTKETAVVNENLNQVELGAYQLSGGKKALALAVDANGRKAYSVRSGDWRQKSSNRKALAACNSKAARHGVQAQCYLFAIGDEAAPSTLKGCAMGRISEKRCAFQRRYPLGGN